MSSRSVTIRELTSSSIRLSWREALALTQSVAAASGDCARSRPDGGTLDQFAIDDRGAVFAISLDCRPIAVGDLATFLVRLLPAADVPAEDQVPPGLRTSIARALARIDVGPASLDRFSQALAGFEAGDRRDLLRAVFERYRFLREHQLRAGQIAAGGLPLVERRASGAGHDILRRFLREADREIFLARQGATTVQAVTHRHHGPSPDMLRRFLRDVDRANYELSRPVARTSERARLVLLSPRSRAVAAVGILLMAAGAMAERQPLQRAIVLLSRPFTVSRPALLPPAEVRPLHLEKSTGLQASLGVAAIPAERPATATTPRKRAAHISSAADLETAGSVGTMGVVDELPSAESLSAVPVRSGQLVLAVDRANKPVFSPSFEASHSVLFDTEGQAPKATVDTPATEFVRVLSISDDRGRNYHPRLSPDGRTIAFDSDRDGVRGVYLASRDGRDVRRVSGPGYAAIAAWSPDGNHLAFIQSEPDNAAVWNVWSLDVHAGTRARLTAYHAGQPWGVSWFPDSRRLCYAHEGEIVVLDTMSGESHSFASPRPDRMTRLPAVSPDGNRVLFQVDNDGAWLLEMADGAMREVLADPSATDFAWSPDGRRIIFRTRQDGWSSWSLQPDSH